MPLPLISGFGAGTYPAGLGPCGVQPPQLVPDPLPPHAAGVPAFEVATHDFRLDANGRYQTVHPYDQAVQLALGITRGELASDQNTGHLLRLAETQGGAALVKRQVENRTRESVALLVADAKIRVDSVEATVTRQAITIVFKYTNLGSQKPGDDPLELRYTYGGS